MFVKCLCFVFCSSFHCCSFWDMDFASFIFSLAKFQISSFIRGSFYSFVQLRSYHIFWEICVERDFFFVRKAEPRALRLSFHSFRTRERKWERERESVRRSGNPFALIQRDLWWKISLSNYRTKILFVCLFVFIFVSVGVSGKRREDEGVIN